MKTNYCPLDPVDSPAFKAALRDHRSVVLELLLGAYALQDITHKAIMNCSRDHIELSICELETALGCGAEAAIVGAEMAGYSQISDGRWLSCDGVSVERLRIPQNLLQSYTNGIANSL